MYTIKLNDGTLLEHLELNGNNFIAPGVVEDSVFENNLDTVVIHGIEIDAETGEEIETETTYNNMRLMSNLVRDGRSWIVLGEKSEEEIRREELERKIALFDVIDAQATYTAMMTDTLLEV